ncbi:MULTISPECIES: DeoR/GlpR family DNA-binding transcription regulator [unclassified Curtobacterium]|uniref:DeoR/GlpR family DNA-binding transcription regulator n=1 Tax=unclassified Curtobacterium TaxID=257496 RepID=UPI0008DE3727|nr:MULTISPECIES: DeoR/GlpR family DNA-binding transcription regulator [unclassified Curtobacterium]OIH98038.1 DeoR family transcriptional regulator [Curtobacterium sp. MCBA15_003]OII14714.1 DeoR family transcriptional regulator [Curtobacterium sp. MCBA15_009]OII32841.1 DeoR family transcriptional regulator [Curtobacterium sp. MMLR14_006]
MTDDDLAFLAGALPAPLRQDRIVAIVDGAPGLVRTAALAAALGTSEVTVRQDLAVLDQEARLRRVHGGAVRLGAGPGERPFEETAVEHQAAKAAIGRAAASLVRSGECVVLDVGTTPAAVATALVARTDLVDVTVVTNSLTTALALEPAVPRFTVVVTGGTLRPLQHSLVAPFNGTVLPMIAADVVFIGGTGVDVEHGLTNVNLPETEAKRMLAASARRTVVVADGSKFGRAHIGVVRALEDIDVVVTAGASADAVATIRSAGVQVLVADGGDDRTAPSGRNHTP